MAKISKDLSTGTLHPRELLYLGGTLGSAGAEILIPADGSASLALDLRGTFNLTVEVSGTVDGANWTPIPVRPVNQANTAYVAAVAGSAAGLWVGSCLGFKQIKARCTAYTSGSATTVISATNAPLDQSLSGTSITANTATGAAGAAVKRPSRGGCFARALRRWLRPKRSWVRSLRWWSGRRTGD